ncbi:hypothetical protein HDU82_002793 [Entophlyctis luteolus]|nr:hypothetical protein HDU82_002793 [Entophlyctis luteolus]
MGRSSSLSRLEQSFFALDTGAGLSNASVSSVQDLRVSVFANWLPVCPPAVSSLGSVFYALTDYAGNAKLVSSTLNSDIQFQANVSNGNIGDYSAETHYTLADLEYSDSQNLLVFSWVEATTSSPTGAEVKVKVFEFDENSVSTVSYPFLLNFQEFAPVMTISGNALFALASTVTAVPCILRVLLTSGTSNFTAECQPLSMFGVDSIKWFMSLSFLDDDGEEILISADGFGYLTTWSDLTTLAPTENHQTPIGNNFTRLRAIPAKEESTFKNFVLGTDSQSILSYFGVPSDGSVPWTKLWLQNSTQYPLLQKGGTIPIGFDSAREWMYICVNTNNEANSEGRLLAFTTTTGDLIWGGDNSGSIPCSQNSILIFDDGEVLATSISNSDLALYSFYGYIGRSSNFTVQEWKVPTLVSAPNAFMPVIWVNSSISDGIQGFTLAGTYSVTFGSSQQPFANHPSPTSTIPVISYNNNDRPLRTYTYNPSVTSFSTNVVTSDIFSSKTNSSEPQYPDSSQPSLASWAVALIVLAAFSFFVVILFVLLRCRRLWIGKRRPSTSKEDLPVLSHATGYDGSNGSPDLETDLSRKPSKAPLFIANIAQIPSLKAPSASSSASLTISPTAHNVDINSYKGIDVSRRSSAASSSTIPTYLSPGDSSRQPRNSFLSLFSVERNRRTSDATVRNRKLSSSGASRTSSINTVTRTTTQGPSHNYRPELGAIADVSDLESSGNRFSENLNDTTSIAAVTINSDSSKHWGASSDITSVTVMQSGKTSRADLHRPSGSGEASPIPQVVHPPLPARSHASDALMPPPEAHFPETKANAANFDVRDAASPTPSENVHAGQSRDGSRTSNHSSLQSALGYTASISSNNASASERSASANSIENDGFARGRTGTRGFGGFWNLGTSGPNIGGTRLMVSDSTASSTRGPRNAAGSSGGVRLEGLDSSVGGVKPIEFPDVVFGGESTGEDEEIERDSFLTAPEHLSGPSLRSRSRNRGAASESEAEGGYVTAASGFSSGSALSVGGYVTAPEYESSKEK